MKRVLSRLQTDVKSIHMSILTAKAQQTEEDQVTGGDYQQVTEDQQPNGNGVRLNSQIGNRKRKQAFFRKNFNFNRKNFNNPAHTPDSHLNSNNMRPRGEQKGRNRNEEEMDREGREARRKSNYY